MAEIFAFADVAQDHLASRADDDDARQAAEHEIDVRAFSLVVDHPFAAANPPPQTPPSSARMSSGGKRGEERNLG